MPAFASKGRSVSATLSTPGIHDAIMASQPRWLTRSRDGDRESSHKNQDDNQLALTLVDDCLRPLTAKRAARRHGHGIGPEKFRRPDSVSTQGTAPG